MKGHNFAVDVDAGGLPDEAKEDLRKLCPIYRHELTESKAWKLMWELIRLLSPDIDLLVKVRDLR